MEQSKELRNYIEEVFIATIKTIKTASHTQITQLLLKRACSEVFNDYIKEEDK